MTGQVGECGVGDEEVAIFESDNPDNDEFEELIVSFPDDHGCCRPVTIWGADCNNVAIFFDNRPTDKQLVFLRQRARKFAAMTDPQDGKHKCITIFGFELEDYRVKHTNTGIDAWKGDE